MKRKEMLTALYKENGLDVEDVYKHKFYTIITRSGIDKIQANKKIDVEYEVVNCERDYCVVKATAEHGGRNIQTFGSALYGDFKTGNTNSHYVMEIAEKRAMSRAVLKLAGFYELGAMGEDAMKTTTDFFACTLGIMIISLASWCGHSCCIVAYFGCILAFLDSDY